VANVIKTILGVLSCTVVLVAASVAAQDNSVGVATACGGSKIKFEVETNTGKQVAQPEPAKALVYFVEDDSSFGSTPKPTTRIGIDGEWVGATQRNSYFYVSLDPGNHHLCASWQSVVVLGRDRQSSSAHFTAEAGGVYYFEVKNSYWLEQGALEMTLSPLDSDQGQLLVSKFPFSASHPKK
jgi:hypothetical protein